MSAVIDQETVETIDLYGVSRNKVRELQRLLWSEYHIEVLITTTGFGPRRSYTFMAPRFSPAARQLLADYRFEEAPGGEVAVDIGWRSRWTQMTARSLYAANLVSLQR